MIYENGYTELFSIDYIFIYVRCWMQEQSFITLDLAIATWIQLSQD